MAGERQITIVGGGLAGLALGIALWRRGIPTTIFEAGSYPRHRVCGEFISGRGQLVLEELGLLEGFFENGGSRSFDLRFCFCERTLPCWTLPKPAYSLPRFDLDQFLAVRFRELGGDLRENTPWRGDCLAEGLVQAAGRRKQVVENGWRWFGLKAHATNVFLSADLEMHLVGNGYVGLGRLSRGRVNVCGLFRRHAREAAAPAANERTSLLRGSPGSLLHERLSSAVFDPASVCAVAALPLRPGCARGKPECLIGDALTMIPPVTGNGMSMALESAWLAAGPLEDYSRGNLSWEAARHRVAEACDRQFASRLAWAKRLHRMLFFGPFQKLLRASNQISVPLLKWGFKKTR